MQALFGGIEPQLSKACNRKTYLGRKIDSRSMAWQLFTDDSLPRRHGRDGGAAMIETIVAVLVFCSVAIFLAHAFDAYHTR
jgi:hypothetical protein